jgi:Domain of unknown function (DUF4123)
LLFNKYLAIFGLNVYAVVISKMLYYNYLLLDAARAELNLYTALELNPNNQSLYKGSAEEDLAGVAPYLFSIKDNTPFADWYFKNGWNNSWGILLFSNAAFEDVYKHFRKFLMVKTEDGQQLYFRFYDPRVLRLFLPTCEPTQLKELFGLVRHFITESEKPDEAMQFWLENSELKLKSFPLVDKPVIDSQLVSDKTESVTNVLPKSNDRDKAIEKPKKKWDFYLEE